MTISPEMGQGVPCNAVGGARVNESKSQDQDFVFIHSLGVFLQQKQKIGLQSCGVLLVVFVIPSSH